ncbi:DcaP family trimeric outer membrane transporter [Sediminitomix flava]|uniref:Porin n=1 Tax=Sediminitomix flava TaxID=379075 RepID=A0A315ZBR1_SEDFL|nr:DcaP family trimeric outer membrane transporter [Sediminitomix flava]PWJ42513.1 hypothetical protein BC781_10255 [Sediminitomix flava]
MAKQLLILLIISLGSLQISYAQIEDEVTQEETDQAVDSLEFEGPYQKTHPQSINAESTVLRLQKGNYRFGLGGYARIQPIYDFEGSQQNDNFVVIDIPVEQKAKEDRFGILSNASRLAFEVLGKGKVSGPLRIYIEGDFSSADGNDNFRLRHAYGQALGFTIGQTWTTFSDVEVYPNNVDFEGPNGIVWLRPAQIRYEKKVKNWIFGAAVENPTDNIFPGILAEDSLSFVPQRVPDLVAKTQYSFGIDDRSHLRVAYVYRKLYYEQNDVIRDASGWGVALSGHIFFRSNFRFMFQATVGEGISKYLNGVTGRDADLVPTSAGDLRGLFSLSGMGAFEYNFSKKHQATFTFSRYQLNPTDAFGPQDLDHSEYYALTYFFFPSKIVDFGMEGLYGRRVNNNDRTGDAFRLSCVFVFRI